jgi:hypothetical protein
MVRLAATLLLALTGCSGATYRWQPSRVSQVPDSMLVRFVPADSQKSMTGRSLGWQTTVPRVITPRGDTLLVPNGTRVSVKAKGKAGHPVAGAIVGWAIGTGAMLANCGKLVSYCGEQDPTPVWSAGLGALVGATIRTDRWVRLKWGSK